MKAIIQKKYGSPDILELQEILKPTPIGDEVLVQIHASSVNFGNLGIMRGNPVMVRLWSGLFKPKHKIPGWDIAGIIEVVGKNVKQFKPGDEVFADLSLYGCGAYAQYVCAPESAFVPKPVNITFEQAAAVPVASITALQGLRYKGQIQSGQKVLINGASGGVGSFALQIAKSLGAEVTAVCSTRNLDTANSMGADHIIDYTREDFTKNGQHYDLILGANGYHPISDYKRSLSPKGIYVCSGGSGAQIFQSMVIGPWISMTGSKKLCNMGIAKVNNKDLTFMKELLETGKVVPVIDRSYQLSEVAEALRYFGEGHIRGKVVITVEHNSK
jgi:NADPH:quinone reductase-like Zn-dependent oxidoreductase